jgi:hypothetical protein
MLAHVGLYPIENAGKRKSLPSMPDGSKHKNYSGESLQNKYDFSYETIY